MAASMSVTLNLRPLIRARMALFFYSDYCGGVRSNQFQMSKSHIMVYQQPFSGLFDRQIHSKVVPDLATENKSSPTKMSVIELNSGILSNQKIKYNIVIFDKDGTITHCNKIFGPFLEEIVLRMQRDFGFYSVKNVEATNIESDIIKSEDSSMQKLSNPTSLLQLSSYDSHISFANYFRQHQVLHELFRRCDYDFEARKFGKTSLMTRGTTEDVIGILINYELELQKHSASDNQTNINNEEKYNTMFPLVKTVYNSCEIRIDATTIEPCISLELTQQLFAELNTSGVVIGVCTQDHRHFTKETLDVLDVSKYVATMACGDDADMEDRLKPAPNGILRICRDVRDAKNANKYMVNKAVMVGDSLGDIEAAVRAGCGKAIFVLSSGFTESEFWTQWEKRVDERDELNEFTKIGVLGDVETHSTDSTTRCTYLESNYIQKDLRHKYSCINQTEIVVIDDISLVSHEIGL